MLARRRANTCSGFAPEEDYLGASNVSASVTGSTSHIDGEHIAYRRRGTEGGSVMTHARRLALAVAAFAIVSCNNFEQPTNEPEPAVGKSKSALGPPPHAANSRSRNDPFDVRLIE